MVAASMNVVGTMIGQAGMTQQTENVAADSDDSEFAQLFGVMSGDATTDAPVDPAAAVAGATSADTEVSIAEVAALSDQMLALLAAPMTASVVTTTNMPTVPANNPEIPALIAADTAAAGVTAKTLTPQPDAALAVTSAANNLPSDMALVDQKMVGQSTVGQNLLGDSKVAEATAGDITNDTTANRSLSTQDIQWLRSGADGAAEAGRSRGAGKAISLATVAATAAQASDSASQTPITNVISPTQTPDLYQQLLSQTSPLLAMAAGPQRERALEAAAVSDLSSAIDTAAALNTVSAQPAGTQLASDVLPFDSLPRQQLHAPVGTHQWATELGNKLTMMATKDTQSATLYMTPADLGPVQVRIDVQQNQASVWFTAEHAETRSALEQSLPRLREMFSAQGMALTDAGVFGDRSRQQPGYTADEQQRMNNARVAMETPTDAAAVVRSISLSMLDAYA